MALREESLQLRHVVVGDGHAHVCTSEVAISSQHALLFPVAGGCGAGPATLLLAAATGRP